MLLTYVDWQRCAGAGVRSDAGDPEQCAARCGHIEGQIVRTQGGGEPVLVAEASCHCRSAISSPSLHPRQDPRREEVRFTP
jgi:hypothetical protein